LCVFDSPFDPEPQIKVQAGRIIELDGKRESHFDMLDRLIACHAIDAVIAVEAMAMDSVAIAGMLADIGVRREEVIHILRGLTPAKTVQVVRNLNVIEMMMAPARMRALPPTRHTSPKGRRTRPSSRPMPPKPGMLLQIWRRPTISCVGERPAPTPSGRSPATVSPKGFSAFRSS
jgi:hypothetical protein